MIREKVFLSRLSKTSPTYRFFNIEFMPSRTEPLRHAHSSWDLA